MVRVKCIKVAFLAYTEMTNGIPLPFPWSVNLAHVGAVEDGMLVFLHITVRGKSATVTSISYVPTWDRHPDYTVLPIGDAVRRHEESADVLRASYDRTTQTVGRAAHVLTPVPAHRP